MRKIDLSDRALCALISKSESATPGPWTITGGGSVLWTIMWKAKTDGQIYPLAHLATSKEDAAFIAACDPETVRAMCCAIGRMRSDLGVHKTTIAELEEQVGRLEKEADWLALVLANACCGIPLSEYIDMDSNGMSPPGPEHWREAARKAVGGNN